MCQAVMAATALLFRTAYVRFCFLNGGGWSLKETENSNFRQTIIRSLECDIFSVNETFFFVIMNPYPLTDINFTPETENTFTEMHKRGSGGVGVFVKT